MMWTTFDTWMVISVVLAAVACALPGTFLLLRKISLMGDAISHAVLPGIAISFLLTGSRSNIVMFIGAAIAAVLLTVITEFLSNRAKVEHSASLGTVFSIFFALGLIVIVQAADSVDLDPNCVLYGAVELTVLDTINIYGLDVPRTIPILIGIVLLNGILVIVFFKELNLTSFDSDFAQFLGFRPRLLHYLLMVEVGITMVAVFQIVGSILSIAMLIIPAAIAKLFSKNLSSMLILAVVFAVISGILGHGIVFSLDNVGLPGSNLAGTTAVSAGAILFTSLLLKKKKQPL